MPTIWVNCNIVDDVVEEWVEDRVEDRDWDQEAWNEWDRLEAIHGARMALRMSLGWNYTIYHYIEWHNMRDGASSVFRFIEGK